MRFHLRRRFDVERTRGIASWLESGEAFSILRDLGGGAGARASKGARGGDSSGHLVAYGLDDDGVGASPLSSGIEMSSSMFGTSEISMRRFLERLAASPLGATGSNSP